MDNLVFLISQPRTGSTMLQAILGGHPDIHTCSEPWIALPYIYALKDKGIECDFDTKLSRRAIHAFFDEAGIDQKSYYESLNLFLGELYNKAMSKTGKRVFLDKTPRYYEVINELVDIFPSAKFVILNRNPLAVLNSILNTWVNDDLQRLYNYSRDLFVAPKIISNFIQKERKDIFVVKFEEILREPKNYIREICEYIGVEYSEDIIKYGSDNKWVFGDKKFLKKNTPDDSSIDSWRENIKNKTFLNFNYYYLLEVDEFLYEKMGYDYCADLKFIENQTPNMKDYKLWKNLTSPFEVNSLDELRRNRWSKYSENTLDRMRSILNSIKR